MPSVIRQRLPSVSLLLAVLLGAASVARAENVTIYRCVDAGGKVALQDRPCPKDAHQDVRQMQRPQDAPARPQPVAAKSFAPPAVEVRVVHVRDPQPLYECRNADGETYLSQTGVPEGRYVPVWTLGLDRGFASMGERGRTHRMPGRLPPGQFGGAPLVYVEDSCVRLPQDAVCQRMRDRNDALGTLIFNAQPSDRERYERERKGLAEQMRGDCGGN